MGKPEKVQSSAGYNSGEQYYRADEMDAYLADRDDDLRDEVAKSALESGLCPHNVYEFGSVAAWCYSMADAFLAERARRREVQK